MKLKINITVSKNILIKKVISHHSTYDTNFPPLNTFHLGIYIVHSDRIAVENLYLIYIHILGIRQIFHNILTDIFLLFCRIHNFFPVFHSNTRKNTVSYYLIGQDTLNSSDKDCRESKPEDIDLQCIHRHIDICVDPTPEYIDCFWDKHLGLNKGLGLDNRVWSSIDRESVKFR